MIAGTRRVFVRWITGVFAALWAGMASYPFFRYLISGTKKKQAGEELVTSISLGSAEEFLSGASKNFKFGSAPALLVRSEDGAFHAYNAICTHLGCTVQYNEEKKNIWCACHGGVYDTASGKNLAGPPPKPLKALNVEVQEGEIIVSRA